jgi:hypothetical protein
MSRLIAIFAPLTLAAPGLAAPALPDKEEAALRALVEGLFQDAGKGDWVGYARRTDPAALKTFRDDFAAVLTAADKAGRADQFLPLFDGARDVKAVLAYPFEEFFARFMKGAAAAAHNLDAGKAEVLGAVAEGSDRAHVVVRASRKLPGGEKGVVEVVSVRKVGGEWKAELPQVLTTVISSLRVTGGVETEKKVDVVQPDRPKK